MLRPLNLSSFIFYYKYEGVCVFLFMRKNIQIEALYTLHAAESVLSDFFWTLQIYVTSAVLIDLYSVH